MPTRPHALLISRDPATARQLAQALGEGFELNIVQDEAQALALHDGRTPELMLFECTRDKLEALRSHQHGLQQLQQLRDFQLVASHAAGVLISAKDDSALDVAINQCLAQIGKLLSADRCHVFVYSDDQQLITNSHEWCAPGISPQKQRVTGVPTDTFGWLHQTLTHKGIALACALSDLPPEAASVKTECEAQGVRAFVMVPMRGALGTLTGTLGLDSVTHTRTWNKDELAMLRIMSGIIGTALEQQRSRKALQRLSEYRQLIFRLSLTFINAPVETLNEVINDGLASIGTFFHVDRAYVFDYNFINRTTSNTHEWCAPGIESEIAKLQNLPLELSPDWLGQHQQGKAFLIDDVAALSPSAIRDLLVSQHISSLITVPLMDQDTCLGYVGLDAVIGQATRVGKSELDLLHLFAELLVSVHKRKQTDEALRQAASVFEHANEGIMITSAAGIITDVNNAFCRLTGYDASDLKGRSPRMLSSRLHTPEFHARMWQALEKDGNWSGEIWNRRPDGELYAVQMTISAIRDNAGRTQRYVALLSDITRQKTHEAELEQLAHYDSLTGLPNRSLLADRLHHAMLQAKRRDQQIAVAYLDLDGFKEINDTHGHDCGDRLLVTIAERMQSVLRKGDTLARLGGDEFVAVLVDLPTQEASLPLLQRLLDAAAEPIVQGAAHLQVSASVGVSFYPQREEVDADQLLRQADQAMYRAKLSGKNRYHIHRHPHR